MVFSECLRSPRFVLPPYKKGEDSGGGIAKRRHLYKICFIALLVAFIMPLSAKAQPERSVPQSRAQMQLSFAPVVKKVSPAVVSIKAKRVIKRGAHPFANHPFFSQFFGEQYNQRMLEDSLGSGVIVRKSGLIVTNAHVVEQAEAIQVVLHNGRQLDAELVLKDKPSDLALLRAKNEKTLPTADLAAGGELEVGDLVLAIGNPFGVGQSVTSGIVSALARSSLNINDYNFFIQTDAAINPGNSGGPLVNLDGEVVGINTAIYSRSGGSMGIGFAVPSEMVATVIAAAERGQVNERGVVRPWLGISLQEMSPELAENFGLDRPRGALVTDIHTASPARDAGLDTGDIIVGVEGVTVGSPAEAKFRFATVPIGEQASLTILDDRQKRRLKVQAIAPPDKPARNQQFLRGRHPLNGAKVANINPAVASELGMQNLNRRGVIVTDVRERTRARQLLEPGTIIEQVNGEDITRVGQLITTLDEGPVRGGWEIVINTSGVRQRVVVR